MRCFCNYFVYPLFVTVYVEHYNIHTVNKSLCHRNRHFKASVCIVVSLRKQRGLHIRGFQLNGCYYMNAALSWVQTDDQGAS